MSLQLRPHISSQKITMPMGGKLFEKSQEENVTDFSETKLAKNLRSLISENLRTKPNYQDCWLIGSAKQLRVLEEYDAPSGHVTIGIADDGEIEYNLIPQEYTATDVTNIIVEDAIKKVRQSYRKNGGRMDRQMVSAITSDVISYYYSQTDLSKEVESVSNRISDIVYRYTVGLGVFDILLADQKLEDIYIDAPCEQNRIYVTLDGTMEKNSHFRCRTNLIIERKEVMNLINVLKRESGLPYSESNPVLETDLKFYGARATVIGYPLSPNGDAVAIRKHSDTPWTLTRLIANGSITPYQAGLLSFLVRSRTTFLICGARGAGKSSLLSALMFEFPLSQRILSIEDTIELPSEKMRSLGYKIQSMLVDEKIEGDSKSRSAEALRVSLRLGESAIVLGEVRGEEGKVLYESMRTGKAGSSIMGTIHGDSQESVYERVVHDMGVTPEEFSATDVIITLSSYENGNSGQQSRKISEIAATTGSKKKFVQLTDQINFRVPVIKRALIYNSMSPEQLENEVQARSLIHEYLAKKSETDESYLYPNWIQKQNQTVMSMPNEPPEKVLEAFINGIESEGEGN